MEAIDRLNRSDEVTVTIYSPDDTRLYQSTTTGWHSIEEAIKAAIAAAGLSVNPEACVFQVDDVTSGISHRYRINAHGHLKLIV